MPLSLGQSRKWSLLVLLPLLSACVDGGPGRPEGPGRPGGYYPPPRPQQMCTMEYRPVCGERGGRLETFGNSCQANQRGYRIIGAGECRRSEPTGGPDWGGPGRPNRPDRPDWDRPGRTERPDRPDWDRPGRPERPDRPGGICTREYRPVCGQSGGRTRTFPNACEATNAGFGVVSSGECRR